MLAVVGGEECLAVARAAAVVDAQDGVAVVDQVLDERAVALARLAPRTAVDPDQGGHLVLGRRLVRLVEDRRDGQAVGCLEADDLRFDQVFGVDLLAERIGQPRCLGRPDPAGVEVRWGAVAVQASRPSAASSREKTTEVTSPSGSLGIGTRRPVFESWTRTTVRPSSLTAETR